MSDKLKQSIFHEGKKHFKTSFDTGLTEEIAQNVIEYFKEAK